MFNFFNYKLNRKILLAFFLIIIIPGISSFWVNYYTRYKTVRSEIENRLMEGISVYFEEFETIKEKCLTIVSIYSQKDFIIDELKQGDNALFEKEIIDFYKMNLVDIIEIEDLQGEVIFRGHNPLISGDNKIDQQLIQEGLNGHTAVAFEHGQTGFAIRAVAPIIDGNDIVGLFMVGSLFSTDFVSHLKILTLLDNGIYRENQKIVSTYDGLDILDRDLLNRLKAGETVLLNDQIINSEEYSVIIKPIFLRGEYWGAVCLGKSNAESEKIYTYSNRQLVYIVIIGVFLALLIYFFLAQSINISLVKVITGITNYSFDHPNNAIELKRNDEFGLIAQNFNSLIRRIDLYNLRIGKLQQDLLTSTKLATAGQIAANLAHEIRNPLSSIKMMAQIIRSRHLKESNGLEEMNIILEEIDRINNKVKELLEFARPSRMEFLWQDIHPILNSILKLSEYMIIQKEIELTTDFHENIPDLYVDNEKIRICFMNLIVNAIQAMTDGGILRISTEQEENHVNIKIFNSWNPELEFSADQIFEPFFTTKAEGTGLGLAISKLEIDRHNGKISVSRIDDLICFTIALPVKPDILEIS